MKNGKYTKRAAVDNKIKHTTLFYPVEKLKRVNAGNWITNEVIQFQFKYNVKQIFILTQEFLLAECIIKCNVQNKLWLNSETKFVILKPRIGKKLK